MRLFFSILVLTVFLGCQDELNPTGIQEDLTWSINPEYIRQGCYDGRDCIPSLQRPDRSAAEGGNLGYLDDEDLIVGVWDGENHVAYPHAILDWHEVVNEDGYTISYCPLTGSAIHFTTTSEYGVSGLLFNSNLIMYDRDSDSYWPQMLLKAAAGDRSSTELHLKPLVETTWGNWKALFPDTRVINSKTGYSRNYYRYPYGNYRTCNNINCGDYIYFPVENSDSQLAAKDRVYAIIQGDNVSALEIADYEEPEVVTVTVGGQSHRIFVSADDNLAIGFETVRNIEIETWDIASGELTLIEHSSGSRWDITGRNLDSDAPGDQLKSANGYIAYWFSLAAFFPDVELI